jgi:hypothetical protein
VLDSQTGVEGSPTSRKAPSGRLLRRLTARQRAPTALRKRTPAVHLGRSGSEIAHGRSKARAAADADGKVADVDRGPLRGLGAALLPTL